MRGKFITFEGGEGAGKSTQVVAPCAQAPEGARPARGGEPRAGRLGRRGGDPARAAVGRREAARAACRSDSVCGGARGSSAPDHRARARARPMGDQRPLRGLDPHLSGRARQRRRAADRAAGKGHRRRARARPHHHPRHRAGGAGSRAPPGGAATRRSTGSRARRSIFTRSCARPIWSSPSASRTAAS